MNNEITSYDDNYTNLGTCNSITVRRGVLTLRATKQVRGWTIYILWNGKNAGVYTGYDSGLGAVAHWLKIYEGR